MVFLLILLDEVWGEEGDLNGNGGVYFLGGWEIFHFFLSKINGGNAGCSVLLKYFGFWRAVKKWRGRFLSWRQLAVGNHCAAYFEII